MAVNYTSSTPAGPVTPAYLEKQFISFLHKRLLAVPLGKDSTLPEHLGKTVRWQYFVAPTTAIASITEGASGSAGTSYTNTTAIATLAEYGSWQDYSKQFDLIALSGTLDEIASVMAYEAAFSLDTVAQGVADGSTTTVDAGSAMTADALRQAVQKLEMVDAKPHPKTPGGSYFAGVFSAEAAYDMMGEGSPAWFQAKSSDFQAALITPWDDTAATSALYKCIIKVGNNVQRNTSTSPDDDLNIVVGNEAFGVASLATNAMQPRVIVTPPEQLVSEPLRNRGTVGWWAMFASVLFDNNRAVAISSDATGVG